MTNLTNILSKLTALIEKNKAYIVDGSLNRNLLAADARKYDSELLNLLQKDKELKEHFFAATDGGLVFKKDVFLQFIMNKEFLPDSYTKYKIKIGLGAEDGSLLSESGDVVLNWPYKDTILEGGQDKEDQKRSEVFFNEVLAPDQITRLLDDKVFTNWKRYDKDGEHDLDELKDDDNLIIKGNNLVVLHSLKKRYAGKVKLIYIDPPYNTGSDSFRYNDRFTHSAWLTFMKNRLNVARELLADDGLILVQIDQDESHYLKVLMDELFGRDNFRNELIWSYRTGGASKKTTLPKKHDIIFAYSKSSSFGFKGAKERQYLEKSFMGSKQDENGRYYVDTLLRDVFEGVILSPKDDGSIKEYNVRPVLNLSSERVENFQSQKPEGLIELLLDLTTNKGDLVMDYHLGSGTTASAAHKTGRRYIGIEQLYYGDNDPTVRLNSVISGDQSGISKSVDWQGGGSFVYANIVNNSNRFRKRVEAAKNDSDYLNLLKEATSSSFLSYRVDPKKLNEDEFRKLSAAEKRRLLLELIDNNTLFVNYDDINDPVFKVSEKDKEYNKKLYEKN